ncbi:AGE family epimerase/isomerase [Vannielia litorea]|uniref:AGE family epimerase/isomerase n=1 Tax=Vannielia litorea TaxID=1217970 RepID=UPI001C96142A|nr:AGE family epimerase/isomerase [Vannielia litorea]MBY6048476.1 AGE family epimerase/isomerase [Vannielia litorea]MBY6075890.1 AGE family epimerase/isomerase [Vannielia litorea]
MKGPGKLLARSGPTGPGPADAPGFWLENEAHRDWLAADALKQFEFFRKAKRKDGGFHTLDWKGKPLRSQLQELHSTTRMIHTYAMAELCGAGGADMVDHGMQYLAQGHADGEGWAWGAEGSAPSDRRRMAYGHVFVLLAASSAHLIGHPGGQPLIDQASQVLIDHFWEEEPGLFGADFGPDWSPLDSYRGMNANMHGVEALLAAYEATGWEDYLNRAGGILGFFLGQMAPAYGWRIPEHYGPDWSVDLGYDGDPMFRPAGTTPGHSLEFARLLLQHWDLSGRPENEAPSVAHDLAQQALTDGWADDGGLIYTVDFDGAPLLTDRYWWPVTEGIGVLASLIKLDPQEIYEEWYRRLWTFAHEHFIDHKRGGWYPALNAKGKPVETQFKGKPDIYHALQATLYPLAPGLSRQITSLPLITP